MLRCISALQGGPTSPGRRKSISSVTPCRNRAAPGTLQGRQPNSLRLRPRHHQRWVPSAASDDELDLAVFRFTLGIPGFDDKYIPRVVGAAGGALILANHFLGSAGGVQAAQERAEVLGLVLAVMGWLAPTLEQRLKDLDPGRGRVAQSADGVPGSVNAFCLSEELSEAVRKELAWASFALLRNTNTDGVMAVWGGRVLMARGAVGAAAMTAASGDRQQQAQLEALTASVASQGSSKVVKQAAAAPAYLQDAAALFEATGGRGVDWLPLGARSLLMVPMDGDGCLCLWSERPRALPRKQQAWAEAVAVKMASFCSSGNQ